jgi:hypothetical protein
MSFEASEALEETPSLGDPSQDAWRSEGRRASKSGTGSTCSRRASRAPPQAHGPRARAPFSWGPGPVGVRWAQGALGSAGTPKAGGGRGARPSGFPGEGQENNRPVWAEPGGRDEGGGRIASSCTFYWKPGASGGGAGRRLLRRQWPGRGAGEAVVRGGRLNTRGAPGRARARFPEGPRCGDLRAASRWPRCLGSPSPGA